MLNKSQNRNHADGSLQDLAKEFGVDTHVVQALAQRLAGMCWKFPLAFLRPVPFMNHYEYPKSFSSFLVTFLLSLFINFTSHQFCSSTAFLLMSCFFFHPSHRHPSFPFACHAIHARSLALLFPFTNVFRSSAMHSCFREISLFALHWISMLACSCKIAETATSFNSLILSFSFMESIAFVLLSSTH